jgi:hypothetical protein
MTIPSPHLPQSVENAIARLWLLTPTRIRGLLSHRRTHLNGMIRIALRQSMMCGHDFLITHRVNYFFLLSVAMTLPVSSASCERGFM